jgi:hypothetical protein
MPDASGWVGNDRASRELLLFSDPCRAKKRLSRFTASANGLPLVIAGSVSAAACTNNQGLTRENGGFGL